MDLESHLDIIHIILMPKGMVVANQDIQLNVLLWELK